MEKTLSAKTGRKPKSYISTTGETIPGLCRDVDGRWRIVSTGVKWTQADEFLAIAKAKRLIAELTGDGMVAVSIPASDPAALGAVEAHCQLMADTDGLAGSPAGLLLDTTGRDYQITKLVPEAMLYAWLRAKLLTEPDEVAIKTGIPQLRGLATLDLPKPSIRLSELVAVFKSENKSADKDRAIGIFQSFVDRTGASTVDELTTERLCRFKRSIESDPKYTSGDTKAWMYGRIKAVIAFGLASGLDAVQLKACLVRCEVLWTPTKKKQPMPTPIAREHFQALYAATTDTTWKAILLCGLNMALHLEEALKLEWDKINLEKATHAQIREKTEEHSIPRAACLWPETVAALRALKKTGLPLVFVSPRGTRYNRTSRGNEFAKLRTRAGVPDEVTFDWLRDGAYTAACQGQGVDEKHARVLAGHKADGLLDRYVLRHPEVTAGACQAVYAEYGPFAG